MFPRWLSWLFVLFIAYLLYAGTNPLRAPATVQKPGEPTAAKDYESIDALMDGNRWRKAINPDYRPEDEPCGAAVTGPDQRANYAIIDRPGQGKLATCGTPITLQWQHWKADGTKQGEPATVTLTLGVQPGLDALLRGMRPGETRTLVLTVPQPGYKALPKLKPGTTAIATVTRPEAEAVEP